MFYTSIEIAEILRSPNFDIEIVDLESLAAMKRDLQERVAVDDAWDLAIVRAAEDAHGTHRTASGMVLLNSLPNSTHFKGVYYKHADCGAYRDNVHTTAEMLSMLAASTDAEQLYEGFLAVYPKVVVTHLNSENPVFLPV